MGASRERKKRLEAKETGEVKVNKKEVEEAKKNKQFKTIAIVVLIVIVLCAAIIFVLRSDFFYQNATAVRVNDTKYSIAEYNYFRKLKEIEYESYFGDLEGMSDLITTDIIKDATIKEMAKSTMYYDAAIKAGYDLPDDMKADIEANYAALGDYASMMGMTIDSYAAQTYGKGVDAKSFKEFATKNALSKSYQEYMYTSFEFTEEELAEGYVPAEDDLFGYYLYSFYNSAQEDEENAGEITKKLAEEFASKVTGIESFQKLCVEYSVDYNKIMYSRDSEAAFVNNAGESVNETYRDWVTDEARKEGDIEVFTDKVGSYVVYFVNRNTNDYTPVSVRMALFDVDVVYSDYEDEAEYIKAYDEDLKAVTKSAESVIEQWKDGEMTEESFAKLADTYNISNVTADGGLMEIVIKDAYDSAVDDWCYDPARQPGDVGVVTTASSAYALYYIGEYDQTYKQYTVDRDLRAEKFDAWEEDNLAKYVGEEAAFLGFGNK